MLLFKWLLLLLCVRQCSGGGPLTVQFHNLGTKDATLSWVPLEGENKPQYVPVRDAQEWRNLAEKIDVAKLTLRDPLPSVFLSGQAISVGALLMSIGPELDRGLNGTEGLQKLLRHDGAPNLPFPLRVGFRPAGFTPVRIGTVQAKGMLSQDTSSGHRFAFEIPGLEPREVVLKSSGKVEFKVKDGVGIFAAGAALYEDDLEKLRTGPKWTSHVSRMREECEKAFVGHTDEARHFCSPDDRLYVTSSFDYTDQFWEKLMRNKHKERLRQIHSNPRDVHNFTDVGFKVMPTPELLLFQLREFHTRDRLQARPENHPFDDPNLSGRESDTWVLNLPIGLRTRVNDVVKPIVAEWAGLPEDELEVTATYGVRLYHQGSILRQHVDRFDTHILSAIIEIGHLGVEGAEGGREPWPLQITDHAGKEHSIADNAGQLILYESSTCAHGRETRFPGREMANVFVHFRPKGWPKKFFGQRSNEL